MRIPLTFALVAIAGQSVISRANRKAIRRSIRILIPYGAMLTWAIATEFSGSHRSYESVTDFCLSFPPKFLIGPMFLLAFCVLVRTPYQMRFVIGAMVLPVLLSGLVGVMQYLNIGLGDYLHDNLRPSSTADLKRRIVNYGAISTMGLAGSPIEFITTLTTVSSMPIAYFLVDSTNKLKLIKVVSIGLFLVVSALLLVCGSRSGVLAVAGSAAILVLWTPRALKGFEIGRNIIAIFVIVSVVFVGYSTFREVETRLSKSHRISNLADMQRVELIGHSLWAIQKDPIFGYGGGKFKDQFGITPHNGLINAGVYWGIPAMIASLVCYILLAADLFKWLFSRRQLTQISWMTVAGGLCVAAYLWHGMTHNASLTSGGTLFFMVYGIPTISYVWESESRSLRI